MSDVVVRPRLSVDLPALARVLWEQQPMSLYPLREPLPIATEEFLHAEDALAAWTAEIDGKPVGQVCLTGSPTGIRDAAVLNDACARAHGCEITQLGWVSALFVGNDMRGRGVGRLLLDTAVAHLRTDGLRPCLQVLPVHPAAPMLYRASGWREVLTLRPAWLREAVGERGPDVIVMVLLDEAGRGP